VHKAVDVSSLLALREMQRPGKPDAVARIVTRFLEETAVRLEALKGATAAKDSKALERAAHAVVGIAGTVGANEMLFLATRLEQIGRDGHTNGAEDLVVELDAALSRARPVFDRLLTTPIQRRAAECWPTL
jgi:HPt (histidine-containing phosphotransfer) domain-containing protein